MKKKKIFWIFIIMVGIISLVYGINYIFFSPTKINSFIASKIYKAPANKAFTDDNFYKCVVDAYNSKNRTSLAYTTNLSDEQLKTIERLSCSDKKVVSATGVEKLTNLTNLNADSNQLTELDVSKNAALKWLVAYGNQLTKLNVSGATSLTNLLVWSNQLTVLDVSGATSLTNLSVADNQLTELDVSKNTALTYLAVSGNQLTELDVSKNTTLTKLYANNNKLTKLNVSAATALTVFDAYGNQLTELDVSKNTALTDLLVWRNQLTELDVSKNTALTGLHVDDNQLTELDVSKNTALTILDVSGNQLTELDVSKNTALTILDVSGNQLTELDVSKNTALRDLLVWRNQLTELDVSKNTALTGLHVDDNQLTELDVSKNTALTKLDVSGNQLTELDVSKNTALTKLDAHNNQLTELDVSKNTALTYLAANNNQLTGLDVSKNTILADLYITSNSFSENMGIYKDSVFNNSSIDVSSVKLPEGKSSKFIGIQQNNKNIDEIDTANVGGYQYDLLFRHDVSAYNNNYSVRLNLYVIELMSDKYYIDNENSYIYTKADVDKDTILNNVSLNYGEASIEDNKLLIKYDDQVIKEFTIINISSNKYNLNKDYIYVRTGDLDLDSINVTNGQKVIEDNKLKIKYNDKILQEYNLIKISSNKYDLSKDYIYIGTRDLNLESINVTNGQKVVEDNELKIKYNDEILQKYLVLGVRFGTLQVNGKSIVISDDILYDDFIDNITLSDGLTYKIFNGEDEVTSGNISKGMVLNIYYNDKVIDTYEVTDEYLDLSLLDVDEDKHLIKNLVAGTTVGELKKKISTSGTITVIDINNNVLDDEKLVTSGSKLEIKLSKKTYEYILSVRGDVNGDGKVTAADVSKMYRFVKKKISISEECYLLAGDVNDDGKISTADVSKVYRFVKKRINSLD